MTPVAIMLPVSLSAMVLSYYRGVLVTQKRTVDISVGVAIHAVVVAVVTALGVLLIQATGVAIAALAWTVAFAVETWYLALRCGRRRGGRRRCGRRRCGRLRSGRLRSGRLRSGR